MAAPCHLVHVRPEHEETLTDKEGKFTVTKQKTHKAPFPLYVFLIYFVFYSGQAIYYTYNNVFLSQNGLSDSMIGMVGSIGTALLFLVQPLWGVLTDRAKYKNRVTAISMLLTALACGAMYLYNAPWYLALCVVGISLVFNPSLALQDSCALEVTEGTGWDFGNVRLGGTLGYMIFVVIVGYLLKDFRSTYLIFAVTSVLTGVMVWNMKMKPNQTVQKAKREKKRTDYKAILRNKALVCIIAYNVMYAVTMTFSRYYSIYYINEMGATGFMLGLFTMTSCILEIPCFWFAGKIQKKIGVMNTLTFAAFTMIAKFALLALVKNNWAAVIVNLLGGCVYPLFHFCILNQINENVPVNMRATSQSTCAMLSSILSSIVFAPLAGLCSDFLGCPATLLIGAAVMTVSTVVFRLVYRKAAPGTAAAAG